MTSNPKLLVIDLFCGAGGTTTGFESSGVAKVIACINHDKNAIESHKANHPDCFHCIEDIRTFNVDKLTPILNFYKRLYPNALLVLWASAECTNFSNAKGGLPRDADSRSLPNDIVRYVEVLNPDYFICENVREFLSWGELDANGKPISKKNGIFYLRWVKTVQSYGYEYDYRFLNAADFGAYQSRERWFGIFAKPNLPIVFPQPTHSKKVESTHLFSNGLKPHKAVKEVLDLHDIGNSIFRRNKPLVDKTLVRILRGLEKFKGEAQPMVMRNTTPGYCGSINKPCGTILTQDTNSIVTPVFLQEYFGNPDNNPRVKSINGSGPTVVTHGRYGLCSIAQQVVQQKIEVRFLQRYFKDGGHPASVEKPCGTLTTVENTAMVSVQFLDRQFGTLPTTPKTSLTTAQWIVNPQSSNSITKPAPTIITSQKQHPLGLATAKIATDIPKWLEPCLGDTEAMFRLKQYCRENNISDIFLRMLNEHELLRIQGFPNGYKLIGTSAQRKKYIGNAVEVTMAKSIALAVAEAVQLVHF